MKLLLARLFVWSLSITLIALWVGLFGAILYMIYDTFPHGLYTLGALIAGAAAWLAILLAFFKANDFIDRNK